MNWSSMSGARTIPADGVLYFAVTPDEVSAARILRAAKAARATVGRAGGERPASALQVCLIGFEFSPVRAADLERAFQVGERLRWPPFEAVLVRGSSAGREAPVRAYLLTGDAGTDAAFTSLHDALWDVADEVGLALTRRRPFAPHMTIAYDRTPLSETPLAEPVRWPAYELALIHTRSSSRDRQVLRRWRLRAPEDARVARSG